MPRFTPENTPRVGRAALADLNAAYEVRLSELRAQGIDVDGVSSIPLRNRVAARILREHERCSVETCAERVGRAIIVGNMEAL